MNAIRPALAAALFLVGSGTADAQSFQGVTCVEVRLLSSAERDYWSYRLNLSAEQRHRIYRACYQNHYAGGAEDIDQTGLKNTAQ
jgi:hypothetical protein